MPLTTVQDKMLTTPAALHYYFLSGLQTVSSAMVSVLPHGLSSTPTIAIAVLRCVTVEHNYLLFDEIQIGVGAAPGLATVAVDAINCTTFLQTLPIIPDKTTGTPFSITAANWKLSVRAWV